MTSIHDMARNGLTRRALILATPSLLLPGAALAALAPTPGAGEGPFYPVRMPTDDDADLVRVDGAVREAGGNILHLAGRVLDADARPIAGARVEIWQCDATASICIPATAGVRHATRASRASVTQRPTPPGASPSAPSCRFPIPGARRISTSRFWVDDANCSPPRSTAPAIPRTRPTFCFVALRGMSSAASR